MQSLECGVAQCSQIERFIIDGQIKDAVAEPITFSARIARHIPSLQECGKSTMDHALGHASRIAELRYAACVSAADEHLPVLQSAVRRVAAITSVQRVSMGPIV